MKTGRPRIEIDQEEFEKLCGIQCTETEIAAWFRCDIDTLCNWAKRTYKKTFSEVFAEKREAGRISLRRKQWQLAETNATMCIWLGKNYLGQRDTKEITVTQTLTKAAVDEVEALIDGVDTGTD